MPRRKERQIAALERVADNARRELCPRQDKLRFYSRKEARLYIRQKAGAGQMSDPRGVHVYLCACGLFHIGHRVPKPMPANEN